jgi:hypothetical protein
MAAGRVNDGPKLTPWRRVDSRVDSSGRRNSYRFSILDRAPIWRRESTNRGSSEGGC